MNGKNIYTNKEIIAELKKLNDRLSPEEVKIIQKNNKWLDNTKMLFLVSSILSFCFGLAQFWEWNVFISNGLIAFIVAIWWING